jgi:hypothetical protein
MDDPRRFKEGLGSILGELELLFAKDQIGGIVVSIALRDGNVRSLGVYDDGFKILLIAAAAIGQREAIEATRAGADPDNQYMAREC